jgi:broad specificity phosphatase PhoE
VRLFLLTRHGETTLNAEQRVNGDPSVPVPLTEVGREESRRLGEQIANVPIELCIHTRFGRTLETAQIAFEGRAVEMMVEPLFDDIDIGDLEGEPIGDYRAWKRVHTRSDPFPGGESLDDAGRRYAQAFRSLLDGPPADVVLVVCHEISIRYALNTAAGSDELDAPMHVVRNATPYLFDEAAVEQAAERIDQLVGG